MHRPSRPMLEVGLIAFLSCVACVQQAIATGPGGITTGDFNGDGHADLVVSAHNEDFVGAVNTGGVQVIYGHDGGLSTIRDNYWHQNKAGIEDANEADDKFGQAVAVGDFDGDGFDDLAIGVSDEDIDGVEDAGAVAVLYGSRVGLRAAGDELWHQNSPGIMDENEAFDFFGVALAAGDFDDDGFDDLAIGVSDEDIDGVIDAGAVAVLYGTPSGLRAAGDQLWHQNSPDVEDDAEEGDFFGFHLASGDFNGDGFADLAIGGGNEDLPGGPALVGGMPIFDAGAINVLYGSTDGLAAAGDQFWHQNSEGIAGEPLDGDRFGTRLTSGDFNGDGEDDLAIGNPYDGEVLEVNLNQIAFAQSGNVTVLYGSSDGLTAEGSQFWTQSTPDIPEDPASFDFFGFAIAAGDFDDDGNDDLAIGVPGKAKLSGIAHVLYGSSDGLTTAGNQVWSQDVGAIANDQEILDFFGALLGAGDFDGDGEADLAVGVPGEDLFGIADCGAVNVVYGGGGGLQEGANQFWHQDKANINNHCGTSDFWGGDEVVFK